MVCTYNKIKTVYIVKAIYLNQLEYVEDVGPNLERAEAIEWRIWTSQRSCDIFSVTTVKF